MISSTGDGDSPENGENFMKWLLTLQNDSEEINNLRTIRYAILGLGDTNYSKYQNVPKKLDAKLSEFGAVKVFKRGEVDEQQGLEE